MKMLTAHVFRAYVALARHGPPRQADKWLKDNRSNRQSASNIVPNDSITVTHNANSDPHRIITPRLVSPPRLVEPALWRTALKALGVDISLQPITLHTDCIMIDEMEHSANKQN